MNPDDLIAQWRIDGTLNHTQPAFEAERTPHLHAEYMKLLVQAKRFFSRADIAYKRLYSDKWYYYSVGPKSTEDAQFRIKEWMTMPIKGAKYIKQDLPMTLDADEDVIAARIQRDDAQTLVLALEEIVKQINNRGFHITSMIEWAKFQAGK